MEETTKKIWFKRKRYGWGWYPASREGWLVLLLYVISLALGEIIFMDRMAAAPSHTKVAVFLIYIFIITYSLIYISYKKGEKPKWSWGDKDKNSV